MRVSASLQTALNPLKQDGIFFFFILFIHRQSTVGKYPIAYIEIVKVLKLGINYKFPLLLPSKLSFSWLSMRRSYLRYLKKKLIHYTINGYPKI